MGPRIQHIITDLNGKIVNSNQAIYNFQKNSLISEKHPFFYNIEFLPISDNGLIFTCVNLCIEDQEIVADIEINKSRKILSIVIQDLTSYYENYQLVAQEKNELNISLEKVSEKNFILQEREQFKENFIQNFSHELRNPLMHIISFTSLLSDTGLTQEQRDYVNFIKSSSNKLTSMVEDILEVGKINTGQLIIKKEAFSIVNLLESLRLVYGLKAKQKGLVLIMEINENIPEVLVSDEKCLFQILTNLLDNAIKFTNRGEIVLKVILNQRWGKNINLSFHVSDSGGGIEKTSIPHIFEYFHRLDNAKEHRGLGLGLPLVKKILNALKSDIKVTSNSKGGSVFYFDLSLTCIRKSYINLPTYLNKSVSKTTGTALNKAKKRVMIVEDDEQTQLILFKYLLEEKKYSIEAFSGKEDLNPIITKEPLDFIIVDIHLPETNGYEIASLIRNLPDKKTNKTPIIAITADAYKKNIERCYSSGINTVLTKPFTKLDLINAINTFI
ncbi:ATP-binding protein [Croceitalea sp. P059]|uniref:hybrid sensor histidine kinase/response regulator n=1 Tax=Croceitalea sp. P059 TaxID=3075601 RepID=UPI0028838E29|nr:ATP-binding protein [Croceitalea sp. P059]MDT0539395.1 ATP-binding protein [Croceitalea sp. P059]